MFKLGYELYDLLDSALSDLLRSQAGLLATVFLSALFIVSVSAIMVVITLNIVEVL